MDRRAFISGVVGAAVPWPRAAYAQTPAKARRVGLFMTTTPVAASHITAAFAEGLRELGHVEGKNVVLEYRWAEGHTERFPELVADLVRQRVDVIVASSQAPALAAKRATQTIPIVMVNATDPVEVGLVASLARPGGNVTGLSQQLTPEIRGKQLQLLKEVLLKGSRVVVLRSQATTVGLREYETAGQALGLRVKFVDVRTRDDPRSRRCPAGAGRYFLFHGASARRRAGTRASAAGHLLVPGVHRSGRAHVLLRAVDRAVPPRRCLCGQNPPRRKPGHPSRGVAESVRAGHQPQDCQGARRDDSTVAAAAGGSGHRVMDRRAFIGTLAGGLLAAPLAAGGSRR